jgi:hypothetical protein
VADVLEQAASGRSKCRACAQVIAKGEWRMGEEVQNPFSEGMTTLWFHLDCAAHRRSEKAVPLLRENPELPGQSELLREAELGVQHRRLGRIAKVERAPSGRATCRQCKELIEKGVFRFGLAIFDEGRFNPMGFIHVACQAAYFEVDVTPARLVRYLAPLDDATRQDFDSAFQAARAHTD